MQSLSEMLAEQRRLGLGPEDYDSFHRAVLELDPASVQRIVQPYFDLDQAVIVVSGDAKSVGSALAQLAPVVVLDPEREFSIKQRLPFSPIAAP